MKDPSLKFAIAVAFLTALVPAVSYAAEIGFDSPKSAFSANEDFKVDVYFDAAGVPANALEGSVIFPQDILDLKEVRDGNSAINFWIEQPRETASGTISFSGITAGGLSGTHDPIFSAIFHSKKWGSGTIGFDSLQLLKNDGLGTKIDINGREFAFSVSADAGTAGPENLAVTDTDPPETFAPSIGNDPSIFGGRSFVTFSTQDKASGIGHYEVKEGFFGSYKPAESPYLLEDQSLSKDIYVKAVDKKGNERVAVVGAPHASPLYRYILIIAIIALISLVIYKKTWPRFTKN